MARKTRQFTRRDVLKYGGAAGAGALVGGATWAQTCIDSSPIPISDIAETGCGVNGEPMATSPFIVRPFVDPLPVPTTLRPGWRSPALLAPLDNANPQAWTVRKSVQFGDNTVVRPGPAPGQQDALGDRPGVHAEIPGNPWGIPNAGTHQQWTTGTGAGGVTLNLPDPLLFHIRLQVSTHDFTTSPVVPINSAGGIVTPPASAGTAAGSVPLALFGQATLRTTPTYKLPKCTIYGFNGTFPGPLINAEYGRPVLVRFENDLDLNPLCRDRQDFGATDWAFLTHLHNGHTAPESDGQPHHLVDNEGGYRPTEWSDNLYLGYPAGGDDREKQSFLWFHDHRMHHTGPNVYKGMVGLMPHYDPILDNGDERRGLRLPGVRTDNGDGTFDVQYDIPLAFYDCRLEDGVTEHRDAHTPTPEQRSPFDFFPQLPQNQFCGNTHPEWWGMHFLKHYPNHGFVGDIFTVNGKAYPRLVVQRRKYRFRCLDASLARQYRLSFRTGIPLPFPGQQGQWNLGTISGGKFVRTGGTQRLSMMQIASEGGLLPLPIPRNEIEIWPAKRREFIVDFSLLRPGEIVFLCNTLQMQNGRKETSPGDVVTTTDPITGLEVPVIDPATGLPIPAFIPNYCVPMVMIVAGGTAVDNSVMPTATTPLRAMPPVDFAAPKVRDFTLERSGTLGGETEWLINGAQFDPFAPLATPFIGAGEAWGINNGGGGWTHPMHLHMEEHHVLSRSTNLAKHLDDTGKEDVVALEPSEQTVIFRRFRTFIGNYVAHCHNLAHEDHNMMFGWTIIKQP